MYREENMSIQIGLDFGSLSYRAAYLLGDEIITVPIPPANIAWQGMIVAQPDPQAKPFGLTFNSIKYYLGEGRQALLGNTTQSDEDVVRDILLKIRQTIITYAGEEIQRMVLAVPARYSAFRRSALRQAAQNAGFAKTGLINDCAAAALGHTFSRPESRTILVYSMGFHGFECSLVRFARQQIRELATDGVESPAGREIDLYIMGAVVDTLEKNSIKVPLRVWTSRHWFELRAIASDLKERLANEDNAILEMPPYLTNAAPAQITFSRQMLDQAVEPAIDNTLKIVSHMLEEANLAANDVDEVLLVGGSTRLGIVQKRLEAMFGPKLVQPRDDLLARGAAIQASRLDEQSLLMENLPLPETKPPVESFSLLARPDFEPAFAYAQQLIEQGQIETARTFLEEIQNRAAALVARLPAH
jgi:molecular chaperone DnaK (HSP70)